MDGMIRELWVDCNDVTKQEGLKDFQVVRLVGYSPDNSLLQIRSEGPTNESKTGKSRKILANARLNLEELRTLRRFLDLEIERLQRHAE